MTSEQTSTPALDLSAIDPQVRVQDDLFRHVNGRWLASTEIPADQSWTGAFIKLRDGAEEAVQAIITGLDVPDEEHAEPTTEEGKIAGLYAGFMDTDTVETAGADPIQPLLTQVNDLTNTDEIIELLGRFARLGVSGLFDFSPDADPGDPQRMIMFAGQSGLGLPDESFYSDEKYAEIRTKYSDYLVKILTLAGFEDAADQAARVLGLETAIAAHHWDRVRNRDLQAKYNLMTLDDLDGSAPGLKIKNFLVAAEIDQSTFAEVVVAQPSFMTGAAELITADRLPDWQSWARFKIINDFAPYLSSEFVETRFAFYGTTLNGIPSLKERWKRGVELVQGGLGEAVGKIYVERHFPPAAKGRMDELVGNLIAAYRESISELDWMTDETRAKALDKLSKFRPKIGFPVKWRDYSSLVIKPGDLIGNVIRAHQYELNRTLDQVGKPVDRDEWFMTPQTVNAYYHPLRNEIVFPAAILQPPFFNAEADDAVNYGGIGAVIGHEIGHGFDDQGSTCDGDGRLINWWTDEDRAAFEERTKSLIGQYDALEPHNTPGRHVNGALTIGENIGDLGGLSIAYRAYKIATRSVPEPDSPVPELVEGRPSTSSGIGDASSGISDDVIDGLTGDQRLFYSYAAIWQEKSRPEATIQRLATDPHSPSEFRCNQIVRNVPAFYDAFGVRADDKLWLSPAERVKIW